MRISAEGLQAIRLSEACRLDAYPDRGGHWTIGYGDTHDVKAGDRITVEVAEQRLVARVADFEAIVVRAIDKRPLRQCQYDALVSLAYNIGAGAFGSSQLVRLLNAGDEEAAARQFGVFIYSRGEEVTVKLGDRGPNVLEWQKVLQAAGHNLRLDGDFGPATETHTKLYWRAVEEPESGVGRVRPKTIDPVLVSRRFAELVRFMRPT